MSSDDNNKKGFGAFDDLVTDISKDIETPIKKPAPKTEPVKKTNTQSQGTPPQPKPQQPNPATTLQNVPGGAQNNTPWGWIIIGVVFVLVIIAESGEKAVEEPAAPASTYQEPYTSNVDEVAAPAAATAEEPPPSPRDPQNPEEMPPVGTGLVLSENQIRYCLSMDVRLGAIKDALDNHSQTEVDNFNSAIEDYNSRCSNFSYRRGLLESIRREVNLNQPTLITEGLRTLESWRGADLYQKKPEHKSDAESVPELLAPQVSKDQSAQNIDSALNEFELGNARAPDLSGLSSEERSSIESVCDGKKLLYGPAAYYKCLTDKRYELGNARAPDLSGLSSEERSSIESVCDGKKLLYGPAAYYKCQQSQVQKLR